MKLIAITILDENLIIQKIVCEETWRGTEALKEIQNLIGEIGKEVQKEDAIYYTFRHSQHLYTKKIAHHFYIISTDRMVPEEILNRHFSEVNEVHALKNYAELNKKIADPDYIASKVKKLQLEIDATLDNILIALDKLMLRGEKIETLVEKTERLAKDGEIFANSLKAMRERRKKSATLTDRLKQNLSFFFCQAAARPVRAERERAIDEQSKYGIN